jgi:hypothetical protein
VRPGGKLLKILMPAYIDDEEEEEEEEEEEILS